MAATIRGAWSFSDALTRARRHGWKVCEWYNGGVLLTHRATAWGVRILYDYIPGTGLILTGIDRI